MTIANKNGLEIVKTLQVDSEGNELDNSSVNYAKDAHYSEVIQTHSGVSVPASNSSPQATWNQVPDGVTEFINNLVIDAGIANLYINVDWSEDGTTRTGTTTVTVSNADNSASKTSKQWMPIGGKFYKVVILNLDAAAHTCSANIKFRA